MSELFGGAKWICYEEEDHVNSYFDIYDTFYIEEEENKSVTMSISADSQYILMVNGHRIKSAQFPDYKHYKVYDEVIITEYIKPGVNDIKILLYYEGESNSIYKKKKSGVIFSVFREQQCIHTSSEKTWIRKNRGYKQGPIEKMSGQYGFTFAYDATKDNFLIEEDINQSQFKQAIVYENAGYVYNKRPIEQNIIGIDQEGQVISQGIFIDPRKNMPDTKVGESIQYSFLSFREIQTLSNQQYHTGPSVLPNEEGISFQTSEEGDGIYLIIDLQEEQSGYLSLDIEVEENCKIVIGYGQHLDDLRVRGFVGGRNFAATYIAKPGRQRFSHELKRVGLRYMQLQIYTKKFKLHYGGVKPVIYPINNALKFKCSDSIHNKIYEVCKRTLHLCMHDHYEDTPWREQALYSMDSRNQMLCGYYAFGEYKFPKASLELMALSLREDGLLELCSPGEVSITIPSFSLIFIVQLYEYGVFTGDLSFVEKYLYVAKRILEAFEKREGKIGLVTRFVEPEYWNFYEWQEGLDGGAIQREGELKASYDAPLNAFYVMALEAYAKMCEALQMSVENKLYLDKSAKIKELMNQYFWSEDQRMYQTFVDDTGEKHWCELTQALMLYCKGVPGEKIQDVARSLTNKEILPITLSHSIFKYESLLRYCPEAAKEIFDEITHIWGNMLFRNATTFWETEKGAWDFDRGGSLCHGWSAIPVYLYYAYALGITPVDVKQRNYSIAPIQNLPWKVKGEFINIYNEIIQLDT